MALLVKMYQNTTNNEKTSGKYYGRVFHIATKDLEDVAQHILEHGSPYTIDVVMGVLRSWRNCMLELLQESYKVRIDGLGTFYLAAESTGSESADEYSLDNIKRLHLRFLPERTQRNALDSLTLRKKTQLKSLDTLVNGSGSGGSSSSSGSSGSDVPVVEQP